MGAYSYSTQQARRLLQQRGWKVKRTNSDSGSEMWTEPGQGKRYVWINPGKDLTETAQKIVGAVMTEQGDVYRSAPGLEEEEEEEVIESVEEQPSSAPSKPLRSFMGELNSALEEEYLVLGELHERTQEYERVREQAQALGARAPELPFVCIPREQLPTRTKVSGSGDQARYYALSTTLSLHRAAAALEDSKVTAMSMKIWYGKHRDLFTPEQQETLDSQHVKRKRKEEE